MTRIKDLLDPVGKKLRLGDPAAAGAIWKRWAELVGDDIARNAEPTSLKEGVLRIRTSSPTWATEMSYLAPQIAKQINDGLKKQVVREIKIWTSPEPITRAKSGPAHDGGGTRTVGRKEPARDPQTAFERAFSAWAKRRNKGPS